MRRPYNARVCPFFPMMHPRINMCPGFELLMLKLSGRKNGNLRSLCKFLMEPFAFERYREIIPDYGTFLKSLDRPPDLFLRCNTLKIPAESFATYMSERGYSLEPVPGINEAFRLRGNSAPGSTLEYFLGCYHIQGLTSMLPVRILDPKPGEILLDLCAAPGGKATHLAQRINNRGLLVANDVRIQRLNILRFHIDRLGTACILVSRYHGQAFPTRLQFHRILLDPPCSAEGTYRSYLPAQLSENPERIRLLSGLQRALLRRALEILRPGGTLVYSTCTYAPEENEGVIQPFLAGGQAEMLPIKLSVPHSPGLASWAGKIYHPDLAKAVRIYPHQADSWGFFIARLRKRT